MTEESDFERGYREGYKAGYNAGLLDRDDDDGMDITDEDNQTLYASEELAEELGIEPGTELKIVRDINGEIMGYM
jgi:hypothetical protein